MKKKISSITRIINQYKGIPVEDIALIQSYYLEKQPDKIKSVLNKPNIEDSTAMAYGRLSSQYIKLLAEPKTREIQIVKKYFKKELSSNYDGNLRQLDNKIDFIRQSTPNLRLGGKVQQDKDTGIIITTLPVSSQKHFKYVSSQILNLGFTAGYSLYKPLKYRVFLEIETSDGSTIVSTSMLTFPSNVKVFEFLNTFYQKIIAKMYYEIEGIGFVQLLDVKEITIHWKY